MNKIALALASAAALALTAGTVSAQAPAKADPNADVTRAQVEQRTAEMFARLDANKDGTFDAADRTLLDAQRAERRTERQHARFDQLDTDRNGTLSRAEFDAGLDKARERVAERSGADHGKGTRGGRPGPARADAKAERAMTQAEFTAAALARFDRADANRDGTVTAAERKAQRAERRPDRRGPKPETKS